MTVALAASLAVMVVLIGALITPSSNNNPATLGMASSVSVLALLLVPYSVS